MSSLNTEKKPSESVLVVGLGQVCVDYVGRVPDYPPEDTKMELEGLFTSCGGPAATAMAALSRWGVPTSLLSGISDDSFGFLIAETLAKEGVDSSCLKTVPGYDSQFAFIAVTAEDGKRTIFWNRSTVPPPTPEEVRLGFFPNARILHLDGLMLPAAKAAAAQARATGVTVVMDAGTFREGTLDLVSLVDVLIASETFADPMMGEKTPQEQALQRLSELGPRQVVITLGARGSIGLHNGKVVRQPAFSVVSKDTTGAGDVYHGGYIYGLLNGWNMPACMAFASSAAALKCRNGGGWRGIPTLHAIQNLMKFKAIS
ncbi:MAG: PfkB family carbohydrate kinase [Deltaproteobacteria bacterium]|jgi:ribokinase|nr:PfkB family carbohydrate kinase [Deltaproteobacteria bacterium]